MSSLNDNFKKLYLEKMQYFFYNYKKNSILKINQIIYALYA